MDGDVDGDVANQPGTVRWGGDRLRFGPFRGDARLAYVAPVNDRPPPAAAAVRHCLGVLAERGYEGVVTAALSAAEAQGFIMAGFDVRERLHLLSHDLRDLDLRPDSHVELRRGFRRDRNATLAIDARSFPPFWRLDAAGLRDAIAATPSARYRVALDPDLDPGLGRGIAGYAVVGRSARRGYVQRLAVDPDYRGRGIGSALVLDGLRWVRRWGATHALVNTQEGNDTALALYERLGFRRQPSGLAVLEAAIG